MVHAQECIALSKGHWAQLWMSATDPKKLKKSEVNKTDVSALVEAVRKPVKPLSLRNQSFFLRGIARIYVLQVEYLYKDCNDAFAKLKMTFRKRNKVDLPAGKDRARGADITLEEKDEDFNEITLNFPIAPLGLGGDLLFDDNGSDTASILGARSDVSAEEARRRSFDANQPFLAAAQDIELDPTDLLNVPGSASRSLQESLAGLSYTDIMNFDMEIDVDGDNVLMDEADVEMGEHVTGLEEELKERLSMDDGASVEQGVGEIHVPDLQISEGGSVIGEELRSLQDAQLDNALDAMSHKDMDHPVVDVDMADEIVGHDALSIGDAPLVLQLDDEDMQEDTPPPPPKEVVSTRKRKFTRDEETRYRKDTSIDHSRGWANRRHRDHSDTMFDARPLPTWIWRPELDLSVLPAETVDKSAFGMKITAPRLRNFVEETFALLDFDLSQPLPDEAADGDAKEDDEIDQPEIYDVPEPDLHQMDDYDDEEDDEKDQPQIFKPIVDLESVVDDHVEPEPGLPMEAFLQGRDDASVDGGVPDPSSFPSFSQGSDFGDETASQATDASMAVGLHGRPRGWSKRTQKTYQYLQKKEEEEFSFFNMLSESRSRATASGVFYEMLVLKNHDLIEVEQEEAYGDIKITKTDEFHSYLARNRVFSQSQSG